MLNKLLLIIIAIIGTTLGWIITDNFIVAISIGQFLLIELVITIMHELYNQVKSDVIKKS
jgi:hypothetical protein